MTQHFLIAWLLKHWKVINRLGCWNLHKGTVQTCNTKTNNKPKQIHFVKKESMCKLHSLGYDESNPYDIITVKLFGNTNCSIELTAVQTKNHIWKNVFENSQLSRNKWNLSSNSKSTHCNTVGIDKIFCVNAQQSNYSRFYSTWYHTICKLTHVNLRTVNLRHWKLKNKCNDKRNQTHKIQK